MRKGRWQLFQHILQLLPIEMDKLENGMVLQSFYRCNSNGSWRLHSYGHRTRCWGKQAIRVCTSNEKFTCGTLLNSHRSLCWSARVLWRFKLVNSQKFSKIALSDILSEIMYDWLRFESNLEHIMLRGVKQCDNLHLETFFFAWCMSPYLTADQHHESQNNQNLFLFSTERQ